MMEAQKVRATFFVSGHVAERYPSLVRQVAEQGHEIACHGYSHGLVHELSSERFRDDLRRALDLISVCADVNKVIGFRAPWWSLTREHQWAWEVLEGLNFRYDSSINPIRMRIYGDPGAPLTPCRIAGTKLWEFPPAAVEFMGLRLSVAGGFYWRHYPAALIKLLLNRINRDVRPAVCYFHPWELDVDQPLLKGVPFEQRLIHYSGRRGMERKVRRIMSVFRFDCISKVFASELSLT